jgi:Ca2+-binding EF-hand superfamily protein
MKTAYFSLIPATLLAAAGTAWAVEPSLPRSPAVFSRLDTDSNGKITLAEIRPKAESRFLRLDTDGNGEVTAAEIDAFLQKSLAHRRAAIMADLDADRNGSISVAELDKFADAMFNGADTDKDGGVTLQEARNFKFSQWRKKYRDGGAD